LHALSAKEETIRQQKISAQHPISWSLINTADSVANTPPTGRPNSHALVVLLFDAGLKPQDPLILGCIKNFIILNEPVFIKNKDAGQ
jgi:hypothetical protein